MEGGSRLRTPMGGVFGDLKMQKPPSLTPGTEASKTPWYHPDSVRTSPSWSDTLHSARHEGKTESITRISWIQARRRVQQDSDWLAPSANSLQNVRRDCRPHSGPSESLPTTPRLCRYHFCSTTDCSRFDGGCLPANFASTTNMRSTGPSRA